MMKLTIMDVDGVSHIHLELIDFYNYTDQFTFSINLNKSGFWANKVIIMEREDLILLRKSLSVFAFGKSLTYECKPMIDEHFIINFQSDVEGHIKVKCTLKDWDYSSEMKIVLNTDQTVLYNFCSQIDELLSYTITYR